MWKDNIIASPAKRVKHLIPVIGFLIFVLILGGTPCSLKGQEIVLINKGESFSKFDKRGVYPRKLLEQILKKTSAQYGPAMLKAEFTMSRKRVLKELELGTKIHVSDAATRTSWEERLIPIRIPIDKGLLGYRLFLINKTKQHLFSNISSIESLKKFRLGTGRQWSITPIFEHNGFNVKKGESYDSLFTMLEKSRFDYFPRGLNEIFTEYENRRSAHPKLHIENTLLLYVPLPHYFFVSPTKPGLADRILTGLNLMIHDKSFDKLFFKYYADDIEKGNLKGRKKFYLDNPTLSPETPLGRKELWLDPSVL